MTIAPKLNTWPIAVFVAGLLGTYALVTRRVRGALLIGIVGTTLLAIVINALKDKTVWNRRGSPIVPDKFVAATPTSLVGQFSFHFVSALGFWAALAGGVVGDALGLLRHRRHRASPRRRAGLLTADGRLPGMRRGDDGRLIGRRGGRRRVGVVEHDAHRELGGHRRGRPHRLTAVI